MVSFTLAAFLVILESAFVTCFWLIKALRTLTDEQMKAKQVQEQPGILEIAATVSSGLEAAACAAVGLQSGDDEEDEDEDEEDPNNNIVKNAKMVGKAVLLENTSMTPNVVQRFPDWEPLPYHCGVITMLVLLLITTVLLTPSILLDRLKVIPSSSSRGLCRAVEGGIESQVTLVKEKLENLTKVEHARFEYNYTKEFIKALNSDILLYGTEEFKCGDVGDSKRTSWLSANDEKEFFTGWCEEQRSNEIEVSEKKVVTIPQECRSVKVKACADGWGLKLFCKSAKEEVCIGPTTYPSPDANVVDNKLKLAEYQIEVERMERVQAEILSVPRVTSNPLEDISVAGANFAEKLKFQVDLISYLYIVYLWIAAFFPSPIVLFRSSPIVRMKRHVFGMSKETFIVTMLALWWGISYFRQFTINPSIKLYLGNLSANPCYVDPTFIKKKNQEVSRVCSELGSMDAGRKLVLQEIEQKLFQAGFMLENCNCKIPDRHLKEFMFATPSLFVPPSEYRLPEWVDALNMKNRNAPYYENESSNWTKQTFGFYLPEKDSPFIGNTTACTDPVYQREQIHEAPESGITWFDLWISSGMLAELLTKFVAANFCSSLLKSADPLGSIDGMYEKPPAEYFQVLNANMNDLKDDKTLVLKTIAVKGCVIWGVLMHLLIINLLFISVTDEALKDRDILFGGISLVIAFLIPCIGYVIMKRLDAKIKQAEWDSLSPFKKFIRWIRRGD